MTFFNEETSFNRSVVLSNGVEMPIFGLGTTHSGGYNHETLVFALRDCGYRLIDTAKRYGVEPYIGRAIKDSKVRREEIFLTTKLWPKDYGVPREALFGSLKRLNTDYLDMYFMHWPVESKLVIEETWRKMELLYDEGLVRSIGVSNFEEDELNHLLDFASVPPHANQCEFHPYVFQKSLRNLCKDNDIQFQGYCPLGKGMHLDNPVAVKWARLLHVSPAQVLLQWSVKNGAVTIPKSTDKDRVLENIRIFDFNLPDEAMKQLNKLHIGNSHKRVIDRKRILESLKTDTRADGYKLALSKKNVFPECLRKSYC